VRQLQHQQFTLVFVPDVVGVLDGVQHTQRSRSNDDRAPATQIHPGQENAIAKAQSYLGDTSFSKQGLIDQLKFDEFSVADATFAVENIEGTGGSSGMNRQDGFTPSQAEYGTNTAYGG
jgi:hypothetical protein